MGNVQRWCSCDDDLELDENEVNNLCQVQSILEVHAGSFRGSPSPYVTNFTGRPSICKLNDCISDHFTTEILLQKVHANHSRQGLVMDLDYRRILNFKDFQGLKPISDIKERYRLGESLGAGQFGEVRLGQHRKAKVRCAIKKIRKSTHP